MRIWITKIDVSPMDKAAFGLRINDVSCFGNRSDDTQGYVPPALSDFAQPLAIFFTPPQICVGGKCSDNCRPGDSSKAKPRHRDYVVEEIRDSASGRDEPRFP